METNNKLREALIKIRNLTEPNEGVTEIELIINDIAMSALTAPPRNCDAGTAEEQSARFDHFCHVNINVQRCCGDCPTFRTTRDDCELVWAQMPCEAEKGDNNG